MANARKTALKALNDLFLNKGFSNLVIDKYIESDNLDSLDSAFASALFLGVTERLKTLDYIIEGASGRRTNKIDKEIINILRLGTYQLYFMDKVPDSAAVNESVKLAKASKKAFLSSFVNAVLRSMTRKGEELLPKKSDLANYYSCSDSIIESLIADYGERAEEILEYTLKKSETALRINPLKTDDGSFCERLESAGVEFEKLAKNSLKLKKSGDITALTGFGKGLFHIQSRLSQVTCETLEPKKGDRILDACAAPGGKSFTIAELCLDNCEIISCDIHPHRVKLIEKGAERLGIKSVKATLNDASKPNESLGLFDKILCDVPCSGLGMMCEKPDIKYNEIGNFSSLPDLQYKILSTSAKMLKRGGRLIYSTCTLRKAENENIVEKFIKNNTEYELVSEKTYFPSELGSGFFVSVIERR